MKFALLLILTLSAGIAGGQEKKETPPATPAPEKSAPPVGPQAPPEGMKWIPGGTFLMGSNDIHRTRSA